METIAATLWTISFGGELRHRHMNEIDRLRPGGPGKSTYDLWRWRNYVDVSNNSWFRVYVEMLDASIFNEDLPRHPDRHESLESAELLR